jgi:protein phosphatase
LPSVDFPQDSQLEPSAQPVEQAPTQIPAPRRRRRWVGAAIVGLLLVGLFGGAWWWVSSQYYVGSDNGNVTVFRGIPQNVGSVSLSSVVETTAIPTVQLPVYAQELVTATIAAESRTDANRIVAILDEQATTCRTKPKTEGCPGVTDGTVP